MDISLLAKNMATNCIKAQKKEFMPGSVITSYMEKRKQICTEIRSDPCDHFCGNASCCSRRLQAYGQMGAG